MSKAFEKDLSLFYQKNTHTDFRASFGTFGMSQKGS
jgi:hypothetical protein